MGGVNGEKLKNPQPAQKAYITNITSQHTAKHQTSHIQLTHTKPQRKHRKTTHLHKTLLRQQTNRNEA